MVTGSPHLQYRSVNVVSCPTRGWHVQSQGQTTRKWTEVEQLEKELADQTVRYARGRG